ncbi:MAG: helix-turn-helix domain-containing protein, partial [Clostridia bacterium]|nr:helix-turn-helix domain-containing protein [Clostridia bacterium]
MAISDKILSIRKEKGLSQEAFAEMLGVSRQSVSRWESGTAVPDIDKIILLSETFGVSTDYLLKPDTACDDVCDVVEEESLPIRTSASDMDDTAEIDLSQVIIPEFEDNLQDIPEEDTSEVSAPIPPVASDENVNSNNGGNNGDGRNKYKSVIAWILVLCIMISTLCIPLFWGEIKNAWWSLNGGRVEYPYVLVHGLGGWGEDAGINNVAPYWGSTSGDLAVQLRSEGFEVYTPSVGPVSSAWDRACELYAQLTGTQVDYGEAHSKEHNHERFGRTYTEPLVENWGEKINGGQLQRINLIGHSFGGATVRLFTSLLEYGSEAEKEISGENVSPLFEGGKGKWVFSVTTLCAPHNGSQLTEILNDSESLRSSIGILNSGGALLKSLLSTLGLTNLLSQPDILNTTDLLISFCMLANNLTAPSNGTFDLMLDHFGIESIAGSSMRTSIDKVIASGNDHAAYDLSPDGAAKLNETIQTVDSVYYFSYAYSATSKTALIGSQAPTLDMLFALQLPALGMGTFKGTTEGGIVIDETWQENDGLVSVISAQKPSDEEGVYHKSDVINAEAKEIEKGIWNISPTKTGHHGTVIGLAPFDSSSASETKAFYIDLFDFIDTLKR